MAFFDHLSIKWGNAYWRAPARHRGRPGRPRNRAVALGHRHRAGHRGRGGGTADRDARRAGHSLRGPATGPVSFRRLERDHRGGPAGRRRGHARRGADPGHGRAGPYRPGRPQPLQAVLRPRETRVRTDLHPPGGHRADTGNTGGPERGHGGLAALLGGVPAGRGPGAGGGTVHGGGPAGRGRTVDAGLHAGRARGVRPGRRPADDHRPPRAGAGYQGALLQHAAGDALPGGGGDPHRTCRQRVGSLREARARASGSSCTSTGERR